MQPDLVVSTLPVASLVPYAENARTHSPAQVAQIAASIAEFGFVNPVLVDAEGVLIAGHGRVMAAKQLGPRLRAGAAARPSLPGAGARAAPGRQPDRAELRLGRGAARRRDRPHPRRGGGRPGRAGLLRHGARPAAGRGRCRPRRRCRRGAAAAGGARHAHRRPLALRRAPPAVRRRDEAGGRAARARRRPAGRHGLRRSALQCRLRGRHRGAR